MGHSLGGYTLHVDGEEYPLRDVQISGPAVGDLKDRKKTSPPRIERSATFKLSPLGRRRDLSGTFTLPPRRLWPERDKRVVARMLNAPDILPMGPERAAEIKRAKRRERNRQAVWKGGALPLHTAEVTVAPPTDMDAPVPWPWHIPWHQRGA